MKQQINSTIKAHLIRGAFYMLLLLAICLSGTLLAFFRPEAQTKTSHAAATGLTFAERAAYQRAIENVYWRHRIWPKERPEAKPSLDRVMTHAQIEKKVADYLRKSQALEDYWQRPTTAEQLQAEMDRMAQHSKQPKVLRELFEALGNDPFVIAECLARPVLAERLSANRTVVAGVPPASKNSFAADTTASTENRIGVMANLNNAEYKLPGISVSSSCVDDTWNSTSITSAPDGRSDHKAVWTGSEMIVWGGVDKSGVLNTGGKYDPSTDSWTATSTTSAPSARYFHTAVWTGSEMIVWGGYDFAHYLNTGGRYNPGTDSWGATGLTNAPAGRQAHTAVWSGSEMIVWGGNFADGGGGHDLNTGGRYNPSTDSWAATSITNAPIARSSHTAVWTGTQMIVWGGGNLNTGGRYDPSADGWTVTSIINAPTARQLHTAVWSGSEMIVWGGFDGIQIFNTGGRYNPGTDSWAATSTTNAPSARFFHTAVWSGVEMIVWGGGDRVNTGGRYNSSIDTWTNTSTTSAPDGRDSHTAVWSGTEMIVWGGFIPGGPLNTGGRYCAQSGPTPTPTPTATAIATTTPTAIPTGSPTATPTPTPTATVSATPTGTPTATPTVSPSSTPTGTPSTTPTASPTPTARPTPTSRPNVTPRTRPTPPPRP